MRECFAGYAQDQPPSPHGSISELIRSRLAKSGVDFLASESGVSYAHPRGVHTGLTREQVLAGEAYRSKVMRAHALAADIVERAISTEQN